MSGGRYIDIPGSGTHELPPLLVHWAAEHAAEQRASAIWHPSCRKPRTCWPRDLPTRSQIRAAQVRSRPAADRTIQGLLTHWVVGRFRTGVDSPMRDHLRIRRRAAQVAASGRVAARQPRELRNVAAGETYPDAGRRTGARCGNASRVPPAAAYRLRFEPVSLLSEFDSIARRLSDVVAAGAASGGAVSAGALSLRRFEHGELILALRRGSIAAGVCRNHPAATFTRSLNTP